MLIEMSRSSMYEINIKKPSKFRQRR